MGKKQISDNIYEKEQSNKKHRGKSKKLEKREKIKKNKKKDKKVKSKKRELIKYIKKIFKENKKNIDTAKVFDSQCLDLDEIVKQIDRLIEIDKDSVNDIPELFKIMEEDRKEIDLSHLDNKNVQKYLIKLMNKLRIQQNSRNIYKFSITNLFRKLNPKLKYTSDIDDILTENINSYYYLVRAIFDYQMNKLNTNENADGDRQEQSEDEDDSISEDKMKALEKEKLEMDYEYEVIEENLGRNAELINKAFNKIMQEDQEK